jgi:hypothetical protein
MHWSASRGERKESEKEPEGLAIAVISWSLPETKVEIPTTIMLVPSWCPFALK